MTATILDGNSVSKNILSEVKISVENLKSQGWTPRLISIKIGDNSAVDLYIRNQRKKADQVGIEFIEKPFPENISLDEIQTAVFSLNADPRVTGIILQRPVPDHLSIKEL